MRRTYTVRPSPAASAIAAVGSVVMLVVGLLMMNGGISQNGSITSSEFSLPGRPGISGQEFHHSFPSAPAAFQILWVIACLGMLIFSVYNLVSNSGFATEVITEDTDPSAASDKSHAASPGSVALLQELEALRAAGLVSSEEYESRREKVLSRFS